MSLPAAHREILEAALRAPSAHNAQAWRLTARADDRYELHYDHVDYLPHDPDDRDAYLAIGAFLETLNLAAQARGYAADVEPRRTRTGTDLLVALITLRPATGSPDPLAAFVAGRHTNRHPYDRTPLPASLRRDLESLGCVLVPPRRMARLVARASILSWRDRRFVTDLDTWTNGDPASPAGMTPAGLPLSPVEWKALRLAFRAGRLPAPLALLFASRDIRLLSRARAVAVLGAPSLSPSDLIDAGRRLLRCWVTINAAGYAYHPISVSVDRPETAPEVAQTADVAVPVAVFRVGHPTRPAPISNRRLLDTVLSTPSPTPA